MKTYHYQAELPKAVHTCEQAMSDGRKPIGFWVSDCDEGQGWEDWCRNENFRHDQLSKRLIVDLDMSKVLHLKSPMDLDNFSLVYQKNFSIGSFTQSLIDWAAVANEFSGILISPYQFQRRLHGSVANWYYSWDCASGCIWNPDAITSIEEDITWTNSAGQDQKKEATG